MFYFSFFIQEAALASLKSLNKTDVVEVNDKQSSLYLWLGATNQVTWIFVVVVLVTGSSSSAPTSRCKACDWSCQYNERCQAKEDCGRKGNEISMQRSLTQCNTTQRSIAQCNITQRSITQCNIIQGSITQYTSITPGSITQHSINILRRNVRT